MAFQKGLGAVHALTHPLGALRDLNLHHGTLNAVLMPAVLRFNRDSIGAKWGALSDVLGGEPDRVVQDLSAEIGLPSGLDALRVTPAMMEAVAGEALEGPLPRHQPAQAHTGRLSRASARVALSERRGRGPKPRHGSDGRAPVAGATFSSCVPLKDAVHGRRGDFG